MRLICGTLHSTPLPWLLVLSNIEPPSLQRKAATDKLMEKIVKHDSWPIQPDILSPPLLRLTSRKPLRLDLQPIDIKSRWRHNWKSAQVVNCHLVCDPTIRQPVLGIAYSFSRNESSRERKFLERSLPRNESSKKRMSHGTNESSICGLFAPGNETFGVVWR